MKVYKCTSSIIVPFKFAIYTNQLIYKEVGMFLNMALTSGQESHFKLVQVDTVQLWKTVSLSVLLSANLS
jgi:hypothetical protein